MCVVDVVSAHCQRPPNAETAANIVSRVFFEMPLVVMTSPPKIVSPAGANGALRRQHRMMWHQMMACGSRCDATLPCGSSSSE